MILSNRNDLLYDSKNFDKYRNIDVVKINVNKEKYVQYNLKWFLLTIITEQEKNYENTFWVPEDEIKPMLNQFNKFRTENEIKDEQFEGLLSTQQNLINKIDNNEKLIAKLKEKLEKYENNNTS